MSLRYLFYFCQADNDKNIVSTTKQNKKCKFLLSKNQLVKVIYSGICHN